VVYPACPGFYCLEVFMRVVLTSIALATLIVFWFVGIASNVAQQLEVLK
jgi:hypothetical protein